MKGFVYRKGGLYCDNRRVSDIAERRKTPFYLYSQAVFTGSIHRMKKAFHYAGIHYAVKANSNGYLIGLAGKTGLGADVVSGGEIFRSIKAGIPANKIIYSGVGKTAEEIKYALRSGIFSFNAESFPEIEKISEIASAMRTNAGIGIRMNPAVNPGTHQHIATGLKTSKFGVSQDETVELYKKAVKMPGIRVRGISIHIGSQIRKSEPYLEALEKVIRIVKKLSEEGISLEYIDLGGGFGISYEGGRDMNVEKLSSAVKKMLAREKITQKIIIEPGRFITAHSGALIASVVYVKKKSGKTFIIIDAAMNDLIRPAMYDSFHMIMPVERKPGAKNITADIVGPVCESGDFLARDRKITEVKEGDLIAVMDAGAYGMSMSSNYNSRPRNAEIIVSGGQVKTIRYRETYQDLVRNEI